VDDASGIGRAAQLGLQVLRSNAHRLSRPYKLTIAVTYGCSHRCRICRIWTRGVENEWTTDELIRFFEVNNYFSWIDLAGGEVSERPDILEVTSALLRAQKRLFLLHFPTSGWIPDKVEALARTIVARKPPRFVVSVSVDGPPALNDRLRGRKGAFEHSMETARRLRAIPGVEVAIGMTLSRANMGQVRSTLAAAQAAIPGLSPRDMHYNVAHQSSHYYRNADSKAPTVDRGDPDEIIKVLTDHSRRHAYARTLRQLIELSYQGGVSRYLRSGQSAVTCRALSASVFVSPQGVVYPCATWDHPLGDLRRTDMDLVPVWRTAESRRIQREIAASRCPGCWTPCEAYPSLLGNLHRAPLLLLRSLRARAPSRG
jgi:MoaA/NifB/PqqE/SkfB family radical SAM enzyme